MTERQTGKNQVTAKQENVSVQAVQQSVERSLATMKKFLEAENYDPYDDPIWD